MTDERYALGGDWRTWVCAIDASKNGVGLRFLHGLLLDDLRGVLRAGSSVLKTWDFGFGDEVDAAAVGASTDAPSWEDRESKRLELVNGHPS